MMKPNMAAWLNFVSAMVLQSQMKQSGSESFDKRGVIFICQSDKGFDLDSNVFAIAHMDSCCGGGWQSSFDGLSSSQSPTIVCCESILTVVTVFGNDRQACDEHSEHRNAQVIC